MSSRITTVYLVFKLGPKTTKLFHTAFLKKSDAIAEARRLQTKKYKGIRIRRGYLSNAPLHVTDSKFSDVSF